MKRIIKIIWHIKIRLLKIVSYINTNMYMKLLTRHLKKIGIVIKGSPKFIASDVYFDGKNYSYIHLGDNITISRQVMFLTHDYSVNVVEGIEGDYIRRNSGEKFLLKEIFIGDNVFIGARVSILPNTKIGNNCIIGACSVVKGNVPDNSVVIGNPWRIITTVDKLKDKLNPNDYFVE